jgi:hypothetical protein
MAIRGTSYKSAGTLRACYSGWCVKEIYISDMLLRKCGKALPVHVFVTDKLLVQYYRFTFAVNVDHQLMSFRRIG